MDTLTDSEGSDKKITITGTANRYLITKLKKEPKIIKTRKIVEKMALPAEYFLPDSQEYIVSILFGSLGSITSPFILSSEDLKLIKGQLESKLTGYRQQDIDKSRYDNSQFISLEKVIAKMHNCKMNCYYCTSKMNILYEIVRENRQWTLDRLDNDIGHNVDNVIIACLECNLKRRRIGAKSFLFTKQLNLIKNDSTV